MKLYVLLFILFFTGYMFYPVLRMEIVETQTDIWDLALTKDLPTLVGHGRRVLTVELAYLALKENIPGDFVETGVYTGGTTILLYKALEKWQKPGGHRVVYACDSFEGLPPPGDEDKIGSARVGDAGDMAASEETFRKNLKKFNCDTDVIRIVKGWFSESLPYAGIRQISYLRLDGDLYASTRDALVALYDKVSPGGYIYVDDYYSFNGCKRAVDEFREENGITEPLHNQYIPEDYRTGAIEAVWWRKS